MKKSFLFSLFLLPLITGILFCKKSKNSVNEIKNDNESYHRIISLSPSTTEILFAIGLGDKVVGVTRYCNYPPEAKGRTKVGGYLDPNYEALLSLQPDLVIILPEYENVKHFLSELGIAYLVVSNKTVTDILSSINSIGKACHAEKEARQLQAQIKSRMEQIKEKTRDLSQPTVLISIGRTLGSGALEDVYIAGKKTFFDELIHYAGGSNAYKDKRIAYPMLSAEGIITINPDIIIDLVPDMKNKGLSESMIQKEWASLSQVRAVQTHHIYVLSQSYTVIPGPRFIMLLEDLAKIIHPEINWKD